MPYDQDMLEFGVFVLVTLAVARITRLITSDQIALPLRRWVVNRYGEDSTRAYLVHCIWCTGMWVALPGAAAWTIGTLPLRYYWLVFPAWLAMSYLTGLLGRLEED